MSGLFEHGYPYTDSHEINLSWVILKVKELAEAWAQVQQDWTDEQAAFANLQSWIENYFNNLNVQTEINVKLDAMVAAGTMSELIAPYVASGLPEEVAAQIGDVVAAQIGPVVAAQIGAVVADQLPAIAASAAATEVGTWLSTHIDPDTGYVIDDSLTVQGAAADAKAVGDEVTAIKSALTVTTKVTARALDFTTSELFTRVVGACSAITTGAKIDKTLTSYDSYYMEITGNDLIYFPTIGTSQYVTICTAPNCTGITETSGRMDFASTESARYRAADSNLPTAQSPLSVHNGDYIIITIKNTDTTHKNIYGLNGYDYDYSDRLKNDLMSRTIKRNACIYDSTASGDITETLTIYLIAKGGYTKVPFCHSINDTTKLCDVWNIQPLYAVDDSFTDRFQISTTGEYECALKIEGASDFIGGNGHGDEYVTLVTVLIDGHNVAISDLTTLTEFDELKIVVNSNLTSPFDHVTVVATHAKEYVFKGDEITINQVVEWKTTQTMDQSYMAMFPVAKAITPKVITDKKYEIRTLSVSGYFNETGTKKAISFSDDFVGTFGIGNWSVKGTNLTGVGKFVITDNGGHPYNKQYFCCCASGAVADGDLWSTTTYYKFEH